MSKTCVICKKEGEEHHIILKSEKGTDSYFNIVYLCEEHHKEIHKNKKMDIEFKLNLKKRLEKALVKKYYTVIEISKILDVNKKTLHRKLKKYKYYKEGYKKEDIIFEMMGQKVYIKYMACEFDEFTPIYEKFMEKASDLYNET